MLCVSIIMAGFYITNTLCIMKFCFYKLVHNYELMSLHFDLFELANTKQTYSLSKSTVPSLGNALIFESVVCCICSDT